MKYLLSLLILLFSHNVKAEEVDPLPEFSPKELVGLLDNGKMKEAEVIYQKNIRNNTSLLFLQRSLLHSRYGAKKISEKDNLIILEGSPWIRCGDRLIETFDGDRSVIKIHKKTMRIVYVRGNFIRTHLLK